MAQEKITVIKGGTLIDGTGKAPVEDAVIVLEGNTIKAILKGAEAKYPEGAKVVDAKGKYVLPGLWDAHLHYKQWMPELLISNGVTSVLAQGGGAWLNAQAEGISKGKILGPRMFLRQGVIGGIYMGANDIVRDTEEARKQVRQIIAQGAVIIKVYTSVTPEILKVVVDEAHKAGVLVVGHIGMSARAAAVAGIDSLAHSTGIAVDVLKPEDLKKVPSLRVIDTGRLRVAFPKVATWDESKLWGPNPDLTEYPLFIEDPRRLMMFGMMDRGLATDLINLLVKEQVFIEACLGYIFREFHDHAKEYEAEDHLLLNDPNLHYIPERLRMNLLDYSTRDKLRPDELELIGKGFKNYQWFIKTFVEAGGKVAIGVDTSSVYHATMVPGAATRREMQLLVDAGLSPMQALHAATRWPAEVVRKSDQLGTLEAGKLADVIVLRKNPLQDIRAFKEIDMVMQDGKVLDMGYHYNYANPIPWPVGDELTFADWVPVSEIPTRITSISPQVVAEGSDTFALTVKGHEFVSSSVVQLGDTLLRTELVDSNQLKATVPADLVKKVGTYAVRAVHRAPGWGKTNTEYLIVKFK